MEQLRLSPDRVGPFFERAFKLSEYVDWESDKAEIFKQFANTYPVDWDGRHVLGLKDFAEFVISQEKRLKDEAVTALVKLDLVDIAMDADGNLITSLDERWED